MKCYFLTFYAVKKKEIALAPLKDVFFFYTVVTLCLIYKNIFEMSIISYWGDKMSILK